MANPYQTYLKLCTPAQLPPLWREFASCPQAFIGPASITEAHIALTACHSPAELIESGLMQLDTEAQLVIHPFLSTSEVAFFVATDRTNGEICDLMTAAGSIRGRGLALYTAVTDKTTCEALHRSVGRLYLTGCWEDAMVLRAAGLPAVPIHGLAEFTGENLQRLAGQYKIYDRATLEQKSHEAHQKAMADLRQYDAEMRAKGDRDLLPPGPAYATDEADFDKGQSCTLDYDFADDESQHSLAGHSETQSAAPEEIPSPAALGPEDITLTLVNWSPSTLSPDQPDAIRTATRRLRLLHKMCELFIEDVEIWNPTPDDWEQIRFALNEQRLDWFVTMAEDSRGYDILLPEAAASAPENDSANTDAAPVDLAAATRRLMEADTVPGDQNQVTPRRTDAERTYRQAHHRSITEPLLREALTTGDPVRAVLCEHLAGLSVIEAETTISLRAHRSNNNRNDDKARDKSLSQIITIGNQIVKFHDALTRSKPTRKPWNR